MELVAGGPRKLLLYPTLGFAAAHCEASSTGIGPGDHSPIAGIAPHIPGITHPSQGSLPINQG